MDRKEIKPIESGTPAVETSAEEAPGEAPKKEAPDTSNHGFKTDDERSEFVKQLIASKKYFVSIRQKKYKRSALTAKKQKKKTNASKPKKADDQDAADNSAPKVTVAAVGDFGKDAKKQNILLIGAALIFIITYLLVDAGILDIGVDVPFDLIPNNEPEVPILETEDNLEEIL